MARRRRVKNYRTCTRPDCGTAYRTPGDLVAAYNAAVIELNRKGWDPPAALLTIEDVEEITYCQTCMRDFRVPIAN